MDVDYGDDYLSQLFILFSTNFSIYDVLGFSRKFKMAKSFRCFYSKLLNEIIREEESALNPVLEVRKSRRKRVKMAFFTASMWLI